MFRSITLPGVRRGTVLVLALACGVMVGNIYLCQPLLFQIARQLNVSEQAAELVAVATQIGYALGIFFVVPLADMAEPTKLIRWLLALTALGLIAATLAPSIAVLVTASMCLATVTVIPQVLLPLAPSLAAPQYRGRIVASLTTGLILGILLSRTVSGIFAQVSGTWRAPYALGAVLTIGLFFILPKFLPQRPQRTAAANYLGLLASLPRLLRHRPLLLSVGMNICVFGAFSAFWATLAFHLSKPPFGFGPAAAGLFGVWGAPGALLAPFAGRLSDRLGTAPMNALGLAAVGASFVVADVWGSASLIALVVAVNLLDFGVQTGQIANQSRIFGIGAAIRGRLNSIYMAATFSGGAIGALAADGAWSVAAWHGVCLLGLGLVGAAALMLCVGIATSSTSVRQMREDGI